MLIKLRLLPYVLLALAPWQQVAAVAVNDAAPNCALNTINSKQALHLSDYRGKVVYVDFWASWCGSCAKSFPFLNELHQQLHARGVEIIGVNLDETPADADAFLAKYPANFTIATDNNQQCAQDFAVQAMPSSYIIDQKGQIHHVHLGFKEGEAGELQALVEKLLTTTKP